MKKIIIISAGVVLSIGLMAFGIAKYDQNSKGKACNKVNIEKQNIANITQKEPIPDLYYGFGPRFTTIQKGEVQSATSLSDFLTNEEMESIESIRSISIIVVENESLSDKRAIGTSEQLTADQIKLLRSFDYSTNFTIQAKITKKNKETGEIEDSKYGPHLTVIPEKQAVYELGNEKLVQFMKENMEKNLPEIDTKKLRPSKLHFTISTEGKITNIRHDNPSGYPSIDKRMIKYLKKIPGKWQPAENAKGEKVEQDLVFTFAIPGC